MAVTPLSLFKCCFTGRPRPEAGGHVPRPDRRVSIAEPAGARGPARQASPGVFKRVKAWFARTFLSVVCCGFRRNPEDDSASVQNRSPHDSTHGTPVGTPRVPGENNSYLASKESGISTVDATSESDSREVTPRIDVSTRSTAEPAPGVAHLSDADDTEADDVETFSSIDSGYEPDDVSVGEMEPDSDGSDIEGGHALNLARVDLSNRDLRAMDLRGANLEGAILDGANLEGVDLTGANLKRAHLKNANLNSAILHGTNLAYADLTDAKVRDARFRYVKLQHANLGGVDLRGAQYVWQGDFTGANLKSARLDGAELLQNRCNLSKAHLDAEGVEALRNEVDDISPAGLDNPRKLQRLLDHGTNGASILTSIDAAPVSPTDKVMMMESLVGKLGEVYRAGDGTGDSRRYVQLFLDKHPHYSRESAVIAAFPNEVPAADSTDLDVSESVDESSRQRDRPRPIAHPRVMSLQREGSSSSLPTRGRSSSVGDSTPRGRSGSLGEFATRPGRSASVSATGRESPPPRSPSPAAQRLTRSGSMSGPVPARTRAGSFTMVRSDSASQASMGSAASRADTGSAREANELAQLAAVKGIRIVVGVSSTAGNDIPHLSGALDVGDPQAIRLLRLALRQGVDFNNLALTGLIEDHMVARQLLEVLDDTPSYSIPQEIDVAILDAEYDPAKDVRAGNTDELWERTITFSHLQDHGVQIVSQDEG